MPATKRAPSPWIAYPPAFPAGSPPSPVAGGRLGVDASEAHARRDEQAARRDASARTEGAAQAQPGQDAVLTPAEGEQHGDALLATGRLAEHPPIEIDDGVGGEDQGVRPGRAERLGLRAGQAAHQRAGWLARPRRLVDVGGSHFGLETDLTEECQAAGGGGGEDQAHGGLPFR